MKLIDWTIAFIKYKDSTYKKIKKLTINENSVLVTLKDDSKKEWSCLESLNNTDLKSLKNKILVCYNTQKNVDWLIKYWNLIKDIDVTIHFVNTDASASWAINPKIHNRFADNTSLNKGILTLFNSIPKVK